MQYTMTRGESLSPTKLVAAGQKFERLHRTKGKFVQLTREAVSKWPGMEIDAVGDAKNPTPSGAIIEAYSDVAGAEGGTQCDMPVLGHLSKPPLGDTEAEGLGETIPMFVRHMYLTIFRKPIAQMTKLNAQKMSKTLLDAVNNYNSWLYDYWDRYWEGNIQHTLLTGYDVLLTNYREISGQESTLVPFSPPNFAVAGAGRVTYTEAGSGRPGTAAYESTIKLKLNGIINDTTKGLTCDRVIRAQSDALELGIPQWKTPYGEFTLWVIDARQHGQLRRDKEYKEDMRFAEERGKGNPIFHAASAMWEGNLFFVVQGGHGVQHSGEEVVSATNSTLGMPAYGPTNFWISDDGTAARLDQNSIKLGHILGPQALFKLLGRSRFEFHEQKADFDRRKEWVLEAYCNLVRGDVFDERNEFNYGANAFLLNQSHFTIATWTPPIAAW